MIAQEIDEAFEDLHIDIEDLISETSLFDKDIIVTKMKKIVPEFKSMNSTYEVLDK